MENSFSKSFRFAGAGVRAAQNLPPFEGQGWGTPRVTLQRRIDWLRSDVWGASFVIGEAGEDFGGVVGIAAAVPELEGARGEGDVGEEIGRPECRR